MIVTLLCLIYFVTPTVFAISQFDLLRRNFDTSTIPTEQILVRAYLNQSLQCPGANEHSLVNSLQWISLIQENKKILEYSKSSLTVYSEQHRISLAKDYGLTIHPVLAVDTGDYICLINGRPEPDGIIQLRVMDVPDPPGRPLIVSFTSRTADLSWASPQNNHFSAISQYIIHSRYIGTFFDCRLNGRIRNERHILNIPTSSRQQLPVTIETELGTSGVVNIICNGYRIFYNKKCIGIESIQKNINGYLLKVAFCASDEI